MAVIYEDIRDDIDEVKGKLDATVRVVGALIHEAADAKVAVAKKLNSLTMILLKLRECSNYNYRNICIFSHCCQLVKSAI